MAQLRDMLALARVGVHQAPDEVIVRALRRSAQKFCRESRIWRERLDDVVLDPGVDEYDLATPSDSTAEQILDARIGGRELNVRAEAAIVTFPASSGPPSDVAVKSLSNTVVVWPNPDAGSGVLRLYVVLAPSRTATEVPDLLVNDWEVGIVAGAQAELHDMPGMPWTNPGRAAEKRSEFDAAALEARRKATSGSGALLRVRPRKF